MLNRLTGPVRSDAEDIARWAYAELARLGRALGSVRPAEQDWKLGEAVDRLCDALESEPTNQVVRVAWFLLRQVMHDLLMACAPRIP